MSAEDGDGAPPAGPEPVPHAVPEAIPEPIPESIADPVAEAGQGRARGAGFRLTPCR